MNKMKIICAVIGLSSTVMTGIAYGAAQSQRSSVMGNSTQQQVIKAGEIVRYCCEFKALVYQTVWKIQCSCITDISRWDAEFARSSRCLEEILVRNGIISNTATFGSNLVKEAVEVIRKTPVELMGVKDMADGFNTRDENARNFRAFGIVLQERARCYDREIMGSIGRLRRCIEDIHSRINSDTKLMSELETAVKHGQNYNTGAIWKIDLAMQNFDRWCMDNRHMARDTNDRIAVIWYLSVCSEAESVTETDLILRTFELTRRANYRGQLMEMRKILAARLDDELNGTEFELQ